MSKLRFVLNLALFVAGWSLSAQAPPDFPQIPEFPVIEQTAGPSVPEPDVAARDSAPRAQSAVRRVATDTVTDGTNGSINFTSPAPYGTSGVLLKSQSSWPNIAATLGGASSSASFSVFDSNDLPLFSVRGDGATLVQKNQNGETVFALTNNDTGASASNAIRLKEGTTTRAFLSANNSGYAGGYSNWVNLFNAANGNLSFGTNNVERMRIYGDGSVAIQAYGTHTAGPYAARFFVQDGRDASKAIFVSHQPNFEIGNPSQSDYGIFVQAQETVVPGAANGGVMTGIYANATLIGAGTLSAAYGGLFQAGTMQAAGTGTVTTAAALRARVLPEAAGTVVNGYGLLIDDIVSTTDYGIYQSGTNDDNYFAGNVGIGTATPQYKLQVDATDVAFRNASTSYVRVLLNPDPTPGTRGGALFSTGTDYTAQPNTASAAGTVGLMGYENGGVSITSGNTSDGSIRLYTAGSGPANERLRVTHNGNVGIGTASPAYKLHVVGAVRFDGTVTGTNIQAHYQDVAEWVPATHDLAPGTVVILNPGRNNEVMASDSAYDTTVAGVVSAQPGLSLGVGGEGKEQIATTGRVKVRVDARNAPIRVGDLLVTSTVAGTAMRSDPMDINGRKFHQPGTILGKALEPLNDGVGEILVLLSMQ